MEDCTIDNSDERGEKPKWFNLCQKRKNLIPRGLADLQSNYQSKSQRQKKNWKKFIAFATRFTLRKWASYCSKSTIGVN